MPGIEQRVARFAQLYSRIGFVHEFRPLGESAIEKLLDDHWLPRGVHLPERPMTAEVKASIIRMTGGNFRLLKRLLTQIERVLDANNLSTITAEPSCSHARALSSARLELQAQVVVHRGRDLLLGSEIALGRLD